jgi:hypothetical protein
MLVPGLLIRVFGASPTACPLSESFDHEPRAAGRCARGAGHVRLGVCETHACEREGDVGESEWLAPLERGRRAPPAELPMCAPGLAAKQSELLYFAPFGAMMPLPKDSVAAR